MALRKSTKYIVVHVTATPPKADKATSLATFKTAMLAITDAPQRTRDQLIAALKARIRWHADTFYLAASKV